MNSADTTTTVPPATPETAHTDSGLASDAPAPLAKSACSAYQSVTELAARHGNLAEYLAQRESALAELVAATTAYDYAQSAKAKRAAGARVVQARNAARAMLSPNEPGSPTGRQ